MGPERNMIGPFCMSFTVIRAPFLETPKTICGPFLGVAIPFVSQERRGFRSSNFTVILLLVILKTC